MSNITAGIHLTAFDLLKHAEQQLENSGIECFKTEAKWLIEEILKTNYPSIITGTAPCPSCEQIKSVDDAIKMRIAGHPLAHILGYSYFYGHKFFVSEGVLIPRPETEILVENAVKILSTRGQRFQNILDLYTGCGNIIISIAVSSGLDISGIGIDIDPEAISCAKLNKDLHNVKDIDFHEINVSDFLTESEYKFDMITANPPYVCSNDIENLQPEIKNHENRIAIDGGVDGLDHYKLLSNYAMRALANDGVLLCEIGYGQEKVIKSLFENWSSIQFNKDYNGHHRVLIAKP